MDNLTHTPAKLDEVSAELLSGAKIYNSDDETIGTISHVHGSGPSAYLAVDVGGFLGLGAKRVLLEAVQIDLMRDDSGSLYGLTALTKEQLLALPEHTD